MDVPKSPHPLYVRLQHAPGFRGKAVEVEIGYKEGNVFYGVISERIELRTLEDCFITIEPSEMRVVSSDN